MSASNFAQIETFDGNNYDTWRLQMKAVLVKNDTWKVVSGENQKSILDRNYGEYKMARKWMEDDEKAKSDIILCIKSSKLKQIEECETSRDVWLKLENKYLFSKRRARKPLLKQLTQFQRMEDGDNVKEQVQKFLDTVDKCRK